MSENKPGKCRVVSNQLFLFVYNIQCLSSKHDLLSLYLDSCNYDLLCLSEHWQCVNELASIVIPGYILKASYCRGARQHGGVAVYVRESVVCKEIMLGGFCVPLHAEFAGVEVVTLNCAVITVYRSSTNGEFSLFIEQVDKLLSCMLDKYDSIFLLGDFNCDSAKRPNESKVLKFTMASYNMHSKVVGYTRITPTSASSLDDLFTNHDSDRYAVEIVEPAISDHMGLSVSVNLDRSINKTGVNIGKCLSYSSLPHLRFALYSIDWQSTLLPNMSSEQSLAMFMDILLHFMDVCGVIKQVKVKVRKNSSPVNWFTHELENMRDTLRALKTVCNVTRSHSDWDAYRQYRGLYRSRVVLAKRSAYNSFVADSDNRQRRCWQLINYERGRDFRTENGAQITADEFNIYFSQVAQNILGDLSQGDISLESILDAVPVNACSFYLEPVTSVEIFNVIMTLKNKQCFDYYNMNSCLLKYIGDIIAQPLAEIFNLCISEGVFPNALKVSKVVPVYKKGSVDCTSNYRPIAISPVLSKVFETVLKTRLVSFIERNHLLCHQQFGFRKDRSTIDAVLRLIGDAVEGLDEGKRTEVTLCDLSKAFDCLAPEILLQKLSIYGIRGLPLELFRSYMTGRKQYVAFNQHESELVSQTSGVPQGSVIGPLLFIIYMNDLPRFVYPAAAVLFADDTTLYTSHRDLKEAKVEMEVAMRRANSWFSANKLLLNSDKTRSITLTTDRKIVPQDPVCLLGIKIDQHLTWGSHVDRVCCRLSSGLYALRKLVTLVSDEVLRMAYFALVHTHLLYGVLLWGDSAEAQRAFILQKKALRIMVRRGVREHCAPWFRQLRLFTLPSVFVYETCLHVHKRVSGLQTRADVHEHDTRGRNLLVVPFSRTTTTQKNRINFNLYNVLPAAMRSLSVNSFKVQLREFLIQQAFYSINQFKSHRFDC